MFDRNLRKLIGDGRDSNFRFDLWIDRDILHHLHLSRLLEILLDKDKYVAEICGGGVRILKWNWRRRLFQQEKELEEVCNEVVLWLEDKLDRWKEGVIQTIE